MYIEPNTRIKIYKNVPLDNTYEHSIYFDSVGAQTGYFHGGGATVKHTLDAQSYQRVNRKTMRVEIKADDLYDCNYLAFQNTAFGVKWFYAFITSVEYVNNITSEITYEIDSVQTYLPSIELSPMYVEREHVDDDTVGLHTVPENIVYGDNIVQFTDNLYLGEPWKVIIHAIPRNVEETFGNIDGQVRRNTYTGGKFIEVELVAQTINHEIDTLLANGYNIDNIYMCPSEFLTEPRLDFTPFFPRPTKIYGLNDQEGYEPRNKKLLTFPYVYIHVTNNQGSEMDLRWEFMPTAGDMFTVYHSFVNVVTADLRANYESSDKRYRTLSITGFPVCSWTENGTLQYMGNQFFKDTVSGVFGAILGGSGDIKPLGSILGKHAAGLMTQLDPKELKGNSSNGYLDLENSSFGWSFYSMGIQREYAEIIDDYFDKFGYRVNRLKVPNVSSRPHWNYVKTNNANIQGSAPADDLRKLCQIFDNGITFWKHGNEVGNYTLDNTI